MVASEVDDTERETAPLGSGRAAATFLSAGSSVHSGISFDSKALGPSDEDLADDAPTNYLSQLFVLSRSAVCFTARRGSENTCPTYPRTATRDYFERAYAC